MNKSLKKIFIIISILCSFGLDVKSQSKFNNDWIDYSKSYIKIPVASAGIFRLWYDDLDKLGVPINTAEKSTIKLFHRGKEQALADYPSNTSFTSFMEFYGTPNDGTLDSLLYGTQQQANKYYNLFSDTTYYFLTWGGTDGKRMQKDSVSITGSAAQINQNDTVTIFSNEYAMGQLYSDYAHESAYNSGEGWTSGSLIGKNTFKYYLKNFVDSNLTVNVNIQLIGRNVQNNSISVYIGKTNTKLTKIGVLEFGQFGSAVGSFNITDNNFLGDSVYLVLDNLYTTSRYSISYLKISYPQKIKNVRSKEIIIPANSADHVVVPKIENLSAVYNITDLNNVIKIGFKQTDSLRFGISDNTKELKLHFETIDKIDTLKLEKVTFKKYQPNTNTFIIVYHPYLGISTSKYPNPVKSYADYRASSTGGNYDTMLVSIFDIYNQFSYGEKTPLGLRLFCESITTDTLKMPKYLFLLGKGYEYSVFNNDANNNAFYMRKGNKSLVDLIPTYGIPGSDLKFVSHIYKQFPNMPAIPIGRFSGQSSQELADYFDKVKEHEQLDYNLLWRKNMIHLSGGKTSEQITDFRKIVDGFKATAEGLYKGAKVKSFTKSTSDIQIFNISSEVNEGVGAITFFGHASATTNDIDIGYVTDPFLGYNNKGKYPLIILNGCKSGNPFTTSSFGENWMKTANKGAISMMGNSDYAFVDLLQYFTSSFYQIAYTDTNFFSKGIGDINKELARRYNQNDPRGVAQLEQMILQGDPSLVFFAAKKPDYYTNNDQLFLKSFDNKPITSAVDSFAIGIVISNFGRASNEDFIISVERTVDGTKKILPIMNSNGIAYKDTLYYVIYSRDLSTAGQNTIKVQLNYGNKVDELNYNNNVGILNFYVPKSGLSCIMPQEFSIVNTSKVQLVVQSTDILADKRDYIIDIDTSYYFNSPLFQTNIINAGASAIWKDVDLTSKLPSNADSVVYFWRVRFKDLLPGEFSITAQSSFIYIKNSTNGWSQTVFEQFNKDQLIDGLAKDTISKTWSFIPKKEQITVLTKGTGAGSNRDVIIKVNGFPLVKSGSCEYYGGDGIYAIAFDKKTLKPYSFFATPTFGGINQPIIQCFSQPVNRFVNLDPNYGSWPDYKSYFKKFVDSVNTGDFVLLVSAGNAFFESWNSGNNNPPFNKYLDKKVEELGCKKLSLLKDGQPYIFLGQKGSSPIIEMIPDSTSEIDPLNQTLSLDTVLTSIEPSASLVSTLIGPTTKWGNFYRKFSHLENPSQDDWKVDILGYDLEGNETSIITDTALADGFDLSSIVNANNYPYLKLKVKFSDFDKYTPAQTKKLQVTYEPVPEGTVVIDGAKYRNIGVKQEGDSISLNYTFHNIFTKDFKAPLLINYKLLTNAKEVINFTDTIKTVLKPDSVISVSKTFKTLNYVGDNVLQIYVNPLDQPEQVYENNRWVIPYTVKGDKINPLLDVFFDGSRIMNGDIVSSNPNIQVILKDENKYRLKQDTVGLSLFIKKCETCDFERISMASPDVLISYPSSSNNNKLSINYLPKNLPDGKYALRVTGADASNNASGIQPYQIAFEVVNKSAISNFYPYPNPFSTATRFVYTLTGSVIPDEVKIQILTATGKVVREITQSEIGQLKTGSHQTDFVWNGTDEFGDKLANGVYLYRVILKANGKELDHRSTSGDKAFQNGWGKMYILR